VAAVSIGNPIPTANLQKALNRFLPPAIRVTAVEHVHPDFHPRYDAISKTYEYRILREAVCSPFVRRYVHHHPYPIDEDAVIEAAPVLEGEHDFSAFAAADDRDADDRSKTRTIYSSRVHRQPGYLIYRVTGSGFLKHMVRNIAGTLLEAGKGNVTAAGLQAFLEKPAPKAGPRAPACGLFLMGVRYPEDQQTR
jgi:tRNA pseudouridine38-40 synthase